MSHTPAPALSTMDEFLVRQVSFSAIDLLELRATRDQQYAFGDVYERTWSADLTALLSERGIDTRHQQAYPESRQTCDGVITLPTGSEFWIEIKGAWSVIADLSASDGTATFRKNGVFRKHLFGAEESALKDVTQKLPTVLGPARHIGLLLIGFELVDSPIDQVIKEFVQEGELQAPDWRVISRQWPNRFDARHWTRCAMWYRVGSESGL